MGPACPLPVTRPILVLASVQLTQGPLASSRQAGPVPSSLIDECPEEETEGNKAGLGGALAVWTPCPLLQGTAALGTRGEESSTLAGDCPFQHQWTT